MYIRKLFNRGRPKLNLELELDRPIGDSSFYPIFNDGKIRGSVAIINDDSKIEELNNRLEGSNQIIRQLEAHFIFTDIIGQSSRIKIAIDQAKLSANTSATIFYVMKN